MEFKCTFDAVAELYDGIRPRYPAVLINEPEPSTRRCLLRCLSFDTFPQGDLLGE